MTSANSDGEQKEAVYLTFRRNEGGGVGDALKVFHDTGACPKRAIKEWFAICYAPLAVPREQRDEALNKVKVLASIYRLMAQIQILQDAYEIEILNIDVKDSELSASLPLES